VDDSSGFAKHPADREALDEPTPRWRVFGRHKLCREWRLYPRNRPFWLDEAEGRLRPAPDLGVHGLRRCGATFVAGPGSAHNRTFDVGSEIDDNQADDTSVDRPF